MDSYRGDGLNLYTYVQNNPIMYIDPTGHGKGGVSNKDNSYFINLPKPDSDASKLDLMADIYTFKYLYDYFTNVPVGGSNYMAYTYLYDNFNTKLVDDIISSVSGAKFIYEVAQVKNKKDFGNFIFSKTLEKYSKRANTLAEWGVFAKNPNALIPIALFDMVKNEFQDKKNLKNLKYIAAIDADPFNMFLLQGYRDKFINQWENITKNVYKGFTDVYGDQLNDDQEYLLYKISSKIGDVISMNKNYNHHINNLKPMFKDIEDKYHEEQFKKTLYYKYYILPQEQGM